MQEDGGKAPPKEHGRDLPPKLFSAELAQRVACKAGGKDAALRALSLRAHDMGLTGVADDLRGLRAHLPALETLYLYNNAIKHGLQGLCALKTLRALYLNDNCVADISGLCNLPQLQKLYLQGNTVSFVTGLTGMPALEELDLSDQKLRPGLTMEFDPTTVHGLASSLRILKALNCNLQDASLSSLQGLAELRTLQLGGNELSSLDAIQEVVEGAPCLLHIDLKANPVCKQPRYKDSMLIMSDSLRTLDGLPVLDSQREGCMRLQLKKLRSEQRADERSSGDAPTTTAAAPPQSRAYSGAGGFSVPPRLPRHSGSQKPRALHTQASAPSGGSMGLGMAGSGLSMSESMRRHSNAQPLHAQAPLPLPQGHTGRGQGRGAAQ